MPELAFLDEYLISRSTMAIVPAFEIEGQSKIYERNKGVMLVEEKSMNIISEGCLLGGSSYDGRKDAVKYRTGVKSKIPVPMNVFKKIGAMPTHSPRLYECHWLFPYHIKSISPHPDQELHSVITFYDGQELHIDVSPYSLRLQKMKAFEAFTIFFEEDLY
ncbi:competence protein ComK [Alteribacillus sp. JSM 102045]|uniref:competence protein ComK n=1 Tax=Alteribacillus sp. JSM 102045 TaxID=1562101 RepID=UPI0035BEBB3A